MALGKKRLISLNSSGMIKFLFPSALLLSVLSTNAFAQYNDHLSGLFLCAGENGVQDVVSKAVADTRKNCKPYSTASLSSNRNDPKQKSQFSMPPTTFIEDKDHQIEGKIGISQSVTHGAIYRCSDKKGRTSFVPEKYIATFSNCQIYIDNRNKQKLEGNKCFGKGKASFNGVNKEYQCAGRSYDSPGNSGGYIIAGSKKIIIDQYHEDYFETSGSCGGTITNLQGQTFHLEPTKDCPATSFEEAKKIAQMYLRSISAPLNANFKERQKKLAPLINRIAAEIGIDPYLAHAVISAESAYKAQVISKAGAQGLMQLMPATAKRFNVNNAFNPADNIRGGISYLKYLNKLYNGDVQLILAAYNAGEGNVKKYGNKILSLIHI